MYKIKFSIVSETSIKLEFSETIENFYLRFIKKGLNFRQARSSVRQSKLLVMQNE